RCAAPRLAAAADQQASWVESAYATDEAPTSVVAGEDFAPRDEQAAHGDVSSLHVAEPDAIRGQSERSGMLRVFPDLEDDLFMELFHKGARAQWTSRDLDWAPSLRLDARQREALARLLTPVYFGERTAMAGASAIVPQLMYAGETTAQLFLSSFVMDEARHFEALTRLYRKLGCDPLGLRQMPDLLRYYHRISQGDRIDWVWGILFNDVNAKHIFRLLGKLDHDPLFERLSTLILRDESRHLAFAERYLRRNLARTVPARRRALLDMRDDLFRTVQTMINQVRTDTAVLGVDADGYLADVWADVEMFGNRIGLTAPLDSPEDDAGPTSPTPDQTEPESDRGEPPPVPSARSPRTVVSFSLPECFG